MPDTLYDEFYDPSEQFLTGPRAFCYDLARGFVEKARQHSQSGWYEDSETLKGILLLLLTWNFAAKETKKLNFENLGELVYGCEADLQSLEQFACSLGLDHIHQTPPGQSVLHRAPHATRSPLFLIRTSPSVDHRSCPNHRGNRG